MDPAVEQLEQAGKALLTDRHKQKLRDEVTAIVDDEIRWLEDELGMVLFDIARQRAERTIKAILNGDKDAAKKLLGDSSGQSRYRSSGFDAGKPWPNLIHGTLFETDGIQLRRKIVEANIDLIRDERIADLEAVVAGLTMQIREYQGQQHRGDW